MHIKVDPAAQRHSGSLPASRCCDELIPGPRQRRSFSGPALLAHRLTMQTALAGTALLMGLVGGPHCVAMCGAACAGVIRIVRAPEGGGVATLSSGERDGSASWVFHAGRVAG